MKNITVFGSARLKEGNIYYDKTYELCKVLAKNGYAITTGGGPGIMQAANKAAYEENMPSIGINIKLPFEQEINKYCTKSYEYSDLSLRKKALMENEIIIVCAGGFGTLDELFEVLTLTQTKLKEYKIILYDEEFFKPLLDFFSERLLHNNLIDKNSLEIFSVANTPQEVLNLIV